MSGKVFPLEDNQLGAADPADNVWLSASAGTGKTQVLSARVLRLLLKPGVEPSQILCLTFTKAGAAEMATRINQVLARWVRMDSAALAEELGHLGAAIDPATQARARTLFASVLDCPGGGLRIDTIHAFSQWLLGNFPEEAALTPGSRPMEDRERELLARDVLGEMLAGTDDAFVASVERFAKEKDPGALRAWLMRCAAASELWEGPAAWQPPMAGRVRRLLDMPADADEAWATEGLHPDVFPDHQLVAMLPLMQQWDAQAGRACAEFIPEWLASPATDRPDMVERFYDTVLTKKGEPRQMAKPTKADPLLPERQQEIASAIVLYAERHTLLSLAQFITDALEMGRAFALRWHEAKAQNGLLDFDDLIREAARLLGNKDASAWIRYKLDRAFDHILIDEAQDTNAAQWDIVFALIDDFFSGEGARGDRLRTIFTVGDYKQAIFGFQGTSPENFERAKHKVRERIEAARAHAHELRENRRLPTWNDLDLGRSFRSSEPVLGFVNAAMEALGHEAFGLAQPPSEHVGKGDAGLVALWHPVSAEAKGEGDNDEEHNWLPAHETLMADRIAEQVRRWVSDEEPFVLDKGTKRHARAGDIMVLVRRRKELAGEIVARLYARGVPVAGVDRLRLGAPLAVKDLMAALRFAAQPLDDLSLANLLVSPLIGWTQDHLLEFAVRDKGVRLWDHLRGHKNSFVIETTGELRDLLARADFATPQALLSWLLNGPWQARRQLIARLGPEANDPIDELVNAAFVYESKGAPSLAGFIEWFDASDDDLKRDADGAGGLVRVMTVHGSKGLQAPIVILADATGEPGQGRALALPDDPLGVAGDAARHVPLPALATDQRVGPVREAQERAARAEMQEHWRLLYVAMTRAEEALFIGGSLTARQATKGVPQDSWYAHLAPLFDTPPLEDDIWGMRHEWGIRADPLVKSDDTTPIAERPALPVWATTPIGPEPRPPRPLAPSSAGEDMGADPPLEAQDAKIAARRGTLIHRLLERLPDIPEGQREDSARRWLDRQAIEFDPAMRDEMLASALKVLADPEYSAIFSPQSLAEVPLAARIGGIVVSGTADRLLVEDGRVTVVDFKTTRRPPASLDAVPRSALRQMAAYVSALEAIYPGREVRAALLYTHAPVLFTLPPAMLDPQKDRLGDDEQSFAPVRIE